MRLAASAWSARGVSKPLKDVFNANSGKSRRNSKTPKIRADRRAMVGKRNAPIANVKLAMGVFALERRSGVCLRRD